MGHNTRTASAAAEKAVKDIRRKTLRKLSPSRLWNCGFLKKAFSRMGETTNEVPRSREVGDYPAD